MSTIELQLITILISILWFDFFGVHRFVLKLFRYSSWLDKSAYPLLLRPFACYFCTCFTLIGLPIATAHYLLTHDYNTTLWFIITNFVVSKILDHVLGYESLKSK